MSLEIFLDNSNNVCFPGQTISGRIECTFNKEKSLHGIKVKFRGRAKTAWTERESSKKTDKGVYCSAEEIYMDVEYNLVEGGENFSLSAGKYVYPFSHTLPSQLPSSFEGSVGNIRYYVEAVVDRPWKLEYEARVPLIVFSLIDLNLIPGLLDPVALSDDKTISSYCCNNSGLLTFNLSLPISGYVPGQEINIESSVKNLTKIGVESVQFKIVAHYEYITHNPLVHTRYESEEIARCEESGISAQGEKSWTSTLLVPVNRIYPNVIHCSIINVNYSLEGEVIIPSHTNLELEFPISIGSMTLSESYPDQYPGGVPPPYLLGGGEFGSTSNAAMGGYSPYICLPPFGGLSPYPPSIIRYTTSVPLKLFVVSSLLTL